MKIKKNSVISVAQCHTVFYTVSHSVKLKELCEIGCTVSHSVELNPHARITLSKIPILSVIQELFTLNILDMRKKSSFTILEQAIISVPELKTLSINLINSLSCADRVKVR